MRLLVTLLVVLTACYPKSLPTIVVHFGKGVAEHDKVIEGVQRWEECGFKVAVEEGPALPMCRPQWFRYENKECRLDITVWADRLEGEDPAWGRAYLVDRAFWIREDAKGKDRVNVATHEIGHLLLNSGGHLAPMQGAMSSVAGDALTQWDRGLLRAIGWPWHSGAGTASWPRARTKAAATQPRSPR